MSAGAVVECPTELSCQQMAVQRPVLRSFYDPRETREPIQIHKSTYSTALRGILVCATFSFPHLYKRMLQQTKSSGILVASLTSKKRLRSCTDTLRQPVRSSSNISGQQSRIIRSSSSTFPINNQLNSTKHRQRYSLPNLVPATLSVSSLVQAAMYIAESPLTAVRAILRTRSGEGTSSSEALRRPSRSLDRSWGTFSKLRI